ncbi:ESCRT-0 subunit protein hse1 [Basidiobolus ranarum]|uniref:ESCRT-0 subunit protein hse1 n=1 Tax=Basidiobolus ranarum TaxID=34480 RepID=A0ABR2VMH7_9FUNG
MAEAHNIDRLLQILTRLDPHKDNLSENEELQTLYNITLSLRPKLVKLIGTYSHKKDGLVDLNEKFQEARSTYNTLMESSVAKYTNNSSYGQYPPQSMYNPGLDRRDSHSYGPSTSPRVGPGYQHDSSADSYRIPQQGTGGYNSHIPPADYGHAQYQNHPPPGNNQQSQTDGCYPPQRYNEYPTSPSGYIPPARHSESDPYNASATNYGGRGY